MDIITKRVIAAYAEAVLEVMEHSPSKENTKTILDTLDGLLAEWDFHYDYGRSPEAKKEGYAEIEEHLNAAVEIANKYVEDEDSIDFDCDEMVQELLFLMYIGNRQ